MSSSYTSSFKTTTTTTATTTPFAAAARAAVVSTSVSTAGTTFLPSLTYVGTKTGYYFGSGEYGVGYYYDTKTTTTMVQQQQEQSQVVQIQPTSMKRTFINGNGSSNGNGFDDEDTNNDMNVNNNNNNNDNHHNKKKKRMTVRIAEEQNTFHENTTTTTNTTTIPTTRRGELLLEQAEKELQYRLEQEKQEQENDNDIVQIVSMKKGGTTTSSSSNTTTIFLDLTNPNIVIDTFHKLNDIYMINEVQRSEADNDNDDNNNDPYQYMNSELKLYEMIVSCQSFASNPSFFYSQLVPYISTTILPLLIHPNTDIIESVITLLLEWYDPTLLVDAQDDEDNDDDDEIDDDDEKKKGYVIANAMIQMFQCLIKEGGLALIVNTLLVAGPTENHQDNNNNKMNEDNMMTTINDITNATTTAEDQVGNGIKDVLTLIENMLEIETMILTRYPTLLSLPQSTTLPTKFVQDTILLSWLFEQIYIYQTYLDNQKKNEQVQQQLQVQFEIRADRCLEILVQLSSREEVYDIVPNWTIIPTIIATTSETKSNNKSTTTATTTTTTTTTYNGIELLLFILARYKKQQPKNDKEVERIENTCLILTGTLMYSTMNLYHFIMECQGIELLLRCCKERVYTAGVALKLLDFSTTTSRTTTSTTKYKTNQDVIIPSNINKLACEHFIKVGGLKYVIPMFMGKHLPKPYTNDNIGTSSSTTNNTVTTTKKQFKKNKKRKKEIKHWYDMIETTTIRILYACITYIQDESPYDAKARIVTKFVEDLPTTTITTTTTDTTITKINSTKCSRLIHLLLKYEQKTRIAEYKFYRSDIEDTILGTTNTTTNTMEQQQEHDDNKESIVQLAALHTKLKNGGDIVHRLACIIAFCCLNSKKCTEIIYESLRTTTATSLSASASSSNQQNNEQQEQQQTGISLIRDALVEFDSLLLYTPVVPTKTKTMIIEAVDDNVTKNEIQSIHDMDDNGDTNTQKHQVQKYLKFFA